MGRLSYRPIALDDLEPYAEFLADSECTRYLLVPEPHSREISLELLKRSIAEHDGTIGMNTLHDGAELVGWAGFQHREVEEAHEIELGWLIRRAHWGKGYASEAALELRPLGPERTIHLIHPDNAASIAVARKLGAIRERDTEIFDRPVSIYVSLLGRRNASERETSRNPMRLVELARDRIGRIAAAGDEPPAVVPEAHFRV